jgi:hypothetical protein
VGIFDIQQPGLPSWVDRHDHSWCPFCYLGWPRDPAAMAAGSCCAIMTPYGLVDLHVPAIGYDREGMTQKILSVLYPRPWEIKGIALAGLDPRRVRRKVPGLDEAFKRERAACPGCNDLLTRDRVPCRQHGTQILDDRVSA